MMSRIKTKIIAFIIVALICNSVVCTYAGRWVGDGVGLFYFYDDGSFATGWRWIDNNYDSLAECYRFAPNGYLITNATTSDGKMVNDQGQWVVDGQVQQIFSATGKPLASNMLGMLGKTEEEEDQYEEYYEYVVATKSTASNATPSMIKVKKLRKITPSNVSKRIDASGKDVYNLYKVDNSKEANSKSKNSKSSSKIPKGDPRSVFSPSEAGYVLSGRSNINKPKPQGGDSKNKVIDTMMEDDPKYLTDEDVKLIGKDMTELVSASNKFTKSVKNVKIWGGDVWPEAMQLSGNGASVKFNMEKYNWFRMEVAHQTHGESTSDTTAYLEFYIGSQQVGTYDAFNDDVPEVIEEWIDDADKAITMKLVVEGDAKGRKVYIREARARKFKEKDG